MKKPLIICISIVLIFFLYAFINDNIGEFTDKLEDSISGENDVKLPFENSLEFVFSSGAGGWSTIVTLYNGGHFKGYFHDSEMGITDDKYPNGTIYECEFSGYFTDIEKKDEFSYKMKIGELKTEKETGKEEIKDKVRHVYSDPYGFSGGEEFIFYLPETPIKDLSEDFLNWWPYCFKINEKPNTLSVYGIMNNETADGFFTSAY